MKYLTLLFLFVLTLASCTKDDLVEPQKDSEIAPIEEPVQILDPKLISSSPIE